MKTVLISAFEPFGGSDLNASQAALDLLASTADYALHKWILPVSFTRAADSLVQKIDRLKPDLILCLGQAAGRKNISLERVALNLMDAPIADNDGNQPQEALISESGPTAYLSSLPLKALLVRLVAEKIPASISNTAGTYVCNTLFYALMHHVENIKIPAGFIHIPALPAQRPDGPSLSAEHSAQALRVIIETTFDSAFSASKRVNSGALH